MVSSVRRIPLMLYSALCKDLQRKLSLRIFVLFKLLVYSLLGLLSLPLFASDPVIITDEVLDSYSLGANLHYMEDDSGDMELQDVLNKNISHAEHRLDSHLGIPSFGFTKSVYWFSFELKNSATQRRQLLLEFAYPDLNRLDLYWLWPDGHIAHNVYGDLLPFAERPLRHRNYILPFELNPSEQVVLMLRVDSEGVKWTPWSRQKDH